MNPVTGNGSPPPTSATEETAMQRDRARTIFERSVPGRRAGTLPAAEVPEAPLEELIPKALLRERPAELPELSEPEPDPEIARNAPCVTPVRRLDEVAANRNPVGRQPLT